MQRSVIKVYCAPMKELGLEHYVLNAKDPIFERQSSQKWRPQGGSNPCYRRERAVS